MSRTIICTVGTSLLTNQDDRPWRWNPRAKGVLPDAKVVEGWLATADMKEASAETNTLRALELDDSDHLALLHSDTPEGRFCAKRLCVLYGRDASATLNKLGSLGYGAHTFTAGLKSLVNVSLNLVRDARSNGRQVVFAATGGFKAEIAFLNLLGALLGIEVVYIHERHREFVRLPRLPLEWNAGFVAENAEFFRWIDEEPRLSHAVEAWLSGQPELRPLVEEGDDGHTYLSAAGDLLYRAANERLALGPRATWPPTDARPPNDKNQLSGVGHHRPDGWERFVNRLCSIDCVSAVRFDRAAAGGLRVKIMDAANGAIGVRFGPNNQELLLRVETTASDEYQCEYVAEYLRRLK